MSTLTIVMPSRCNPVDEIRHSIDASGWEENSVRQVDSHVDAKHLDIARPIRMNGKGRDGFLQTHFTMSEFASDMTGVEARRIASWLH
jgi:hypothetical protein